VAPSVVADTIEAIARVMAELQRLPRLPVRDGTGTPFAVAQERAASARANHRSWRGELTWLEVLRLYAMAVDSEGVDPRKSLTELAAFAMLWAAEIERRGPGHPASQPAPRYQFPTIEKGPEL
jgi:hypothetical protein